MNPETRDDFLWLMSEVAAPILEKVQSAFEDRINPVRIAKSLRKDTSATRSALVMEQAQLRIRARTKFSRSKGMFFTRRGLEQASGKMLAKYKASRFADLSNVGDLCCGIGGDLIALSKRQLKKDSSSDAQIATASKPGGSTIGIDLDELTCLFAARNLRVHSVDPEFARVEQIDFADFDLSHLDGLHVDPDRRTKERTVHGNRFSPNLQDVFERVSPECSVSVKVAPATPGVDYFPPDMQREWIGDRRECKQQVLWLGPATDKPGHRTATYVSKDGSFSQISVAEQDLDQTIEVSGSIQHYIYEPHPTVLAAQLTDFVARQHELQRFTSSIAYLTGDNCVNDPLLSRFEVIDILPLNLRKAQKVLQFLDVGEIEVKKRGIDTVTAAQFARLKLEGPNFATVFLTRLGRTRIVIVAKRKGNPLEVPNSAPKKSD